EPRSHVAADLGGASDPFDADGEGGVAHGDVPALGEGGGGVEGPEHHVPQLLVEAVFLPFELLDVLGPLEVGAGDAAGVGQQVGDHPLSGVGEDVGRLGGRGVVGGV